MAILAGAGTIQFGARLEKSLGIESYYHELSVSEPELSPVQRALFSVLLAAETTLQKHKRQAHSSLPSM